VLLGVALALPAVTGAEPAPEEKHLPAGEAEAAPTAPSAVPPEAGVDGRLRVPAAGLDASLELMAFPEGGSISPPTADAAYSLRGLPPNWPERVLVLHSSRSHAAALGDQLLDERGAPALGAGDVVWLGTERMVVTEVLTPGKSSAAGILAAHPGAAAAIVTCAQDDAGTRPSGSPAAANAIFFLEAAPL
jgi:hypothetical protein